MGSLTARYLVQIVKEVARQGTTQQRRPRQANKSAAQPVNDKQAAEGKIDYVKVTSLAHGC